MSTDQKIVELDIRLEPEEVLRLMGGAHRANVRRCIIRMVEDYVGQFRDKIRPRGAYVVREVDYRSENHLQLRGCPPFDGQIAGFLQPAQRVAAFVVTIGSEIETVAERRMEQGATLEGYTIDAIGSAAADAAVDAMTDYLLWNDAAGHEAVTPPFSPGYCGLPLEQQKILFSIIDTAPLGVELLPTLIMRPIKSVSALVGIGDQDTIASRGIPCEYCKMTNCRMRR